MLLDFSLAAPLLLFVLRSALQGLDQQAAQPVAAIEIGADNLKSHFVDAGAPQQNVCANFRPHSDGNFQIRFTADAEVVVLRSHSAAQAQFANLNP